MRTQVAGVLKVSQVPLLATAIVLVVLAVFLTPIAVINVLLVVVLTDPEILLFIQALPSLQLFRKSHCHPCLKSLP